jgi:hypothetical protein
MNDLSFSDLDNQLIDHGRVVSRVGAEAVGDKEPFTFDCAARAQLAAEAEREAWERERTPEREKRKIEREE